MPIATNLRGKNCNVYPFTFTDIPVGDPINKYDLLSVIENGTSFKYFLGVPETTSSNFGSLPADLYLYDKPTLPTLPAAFNVETATLFDTNFPGWQLQSMLVYSGGGYTGAVEKSECIGLFPNALNITGFIDDPNFRGFVFHFPDLDYAIEVHRNDPASETLNQDSKLFDLTSSSSYSSQFFSSLYFKTGKLCATVQTGYLSGENRFGQYANLNSAINQMSDSVYYSNKRYGNGVPEFFFRSLEKDFIPPHSDIPDDPYQPGGESGPGGGGGDFDGSGDTIDIPPLPTLSAIGTGFVTLYIPTIAQLRALADYMWNATSSIIDILRKIVADPIDLILGLNIVPVTPPLAGSKSVVVGIVDTEVAMNYTNTQYVEVDCGTINVNEYWGAYLDYSPYTKCEIYLPYCGYHAIDIDDVMNKSVRVVYHVDILSGSVCAFVQCAGSVLYQFNGNFAAEIPVTSEQYGDMVASVMSIASTLAGLPSVGAGIEAAGAAHAASEYGGATASELRLSEAAQSASSAANNVIKGKPNIARSGVIGSMGGQLAVQKPYLILTRPRQSLPAGQNHFKGYPSNITATLGSLSGYTVVDSIRLENIPCTLEEQQEIDAILKAGVII